MGINPGDPNRVIKYLGSLHSHISREVLILKPKTLDEACIQAQYIENDKKKVQPSGSK